MASVPFAGVATFGSSRRVAGSRRGVSPTPRVAGVTRVAGGHESHGPPRNRNGCASRHPCRLDRRVVTRLHAVREPSSGGEFGVDVVSTSFIAGDDRSGVGNDNTTASADAARRVRAAKKGASSYRVSGGDGGVSSGDDGEGEGEVLGETRGAGDDACKKQIEPAKKKTGGGRRGKSYAVSRRGTGGTQPLNEGPNGTQQQNLHKKVTMSAALKRTRYNRPIASKESSENSSEDVVRGNDDRPRWLSNQHTAGPGQQAQQKRSNLTGGSRGNNGGAPMRPGERIVAALQKVQVSDGVERLSWEHDDTTGVGQRLTRDTTEVSYGTIHSAVTKPLGGKAKFSAPTLNFAIKELGERGDFNRAHALFLWMRAQGKGVKKNPGYRDRTQDRTGDEPGNKYAPNRHTLASLFGCASDKAHAKTVTRVWKDSCLLDPHEFRNSEVASAAIAALARCENWPAAVQVWQDLGDKGEPRNIFVYTAVLSALRDAKRWEEAGDVFRAMRDESGCSPDATCAGLTLAAFDGARKWREGIALAKRFGDVYGVVADERLTHSIISVAGRAGDTVFARTTLDKALQNRSHVVTTYTYNCLLGGYARSADWENANSTFAELLQGKFVPDAYTFTHLISAAERAGAHAEADAVWARATEVSEKKPGIGSFGSTGSNLGAKPLCGLKMPTFKPHTVMCGAYVHCLGTQGRWMEAEVVVERMRSVWGVERNAAVYNALLGALLRGDKIAEALVVFDRMQGESENVLPTEITFMLLIRACVENGFTQKAKELSRTRDALAESGALENDFSKYESRDDALRNAHLFSPGGNARFNDSSDEGFYAAPASERSNYHSATYDEDENKRHYDASAVTGRLSAGLPPREKEKGPRGSGSY